MSALPARAEIVAPGRALVRAGRALEEGGRRRQAGRSGGGGSGRGNGGAPRAAAVRASVGAGQSRDRLGAAGAAAPRAHPCLWAAQGVRDRRRRASGAADRSGSGGQRLRSEEHTSELQSLAYLVCRLLLEKKKTITHATLHMIANSKPVALSGALRALTVLDREAVHVLHRWLHSRQLDQLGYALRRRIHSS